jgi:hypothetical protein
MAGKAIQQKAMKIKYTLLSRVEIQADLYTALRLIAA